MLSTSLALSIWQFLPLVYITPQWITVVSDRRKTLVKDTYSDYSSYSYMIPDYYMSEIKFCYSKVNLALQIMTTYRIIQKQQI